LVLQQISSFHIHGVINTFEKPDLIFIIANVALLAPLTITLPRKVIVVFHFFKI
jgi:hypothetical protein